MILLKELERTKTDAPSSVLCTNCLASYIANVLIPSNSLGFTLDPMTLQAALANEPQAIFNPYFNQAIYTPSKLPLVA